VIYFLYRAELFQELHIKGWSCSVRENSRPAERKVKWLRDWMSTSNKRSFSRPPVLMEGRSLIVGQQVNKIKGPHDFERGITGEICQHRNILSLSQRTASGTNIKGWSCSKIWKCVSAHPADDGFGRNA
jgi:hypothetical protein